MEESCYQRVSEKLNIHVDNTCPSLVDQVEWDMSKKHNNPEEFAGLGGDFVIAVAYSIRGQLLSHYRTYDFSEAPLYTIDVPFRNPSDANAWDPFFGNINRCRNEKDTCGSYERAIATIFSQ